MKSGMTVGQKLTISFAGLIVLVLGLGVSTLTTVNKLGTALDVTGSKSSRKLELAGIINATESDMAAVERAFIIMSAAKDAAGASAAERSFEENITQMKSAIEEYRRLALLAETRQDLSDIEQRVEQWRAGFAQVVSAARSGSLDEATRLAMSKDLTLYETIGADATRLIALQQRVTGQDIADGASVASMSRWMAIGFIGISCLVGTIVLIVIRNINRVLRSLAAGLSEGAEHVAGAAGQISSASQTLAQGASEQAASLEETSASSEEIATMTRRNAEHSEEAASLMVATTASVDGANRKMEEMVHSMKEITTSSDKISKIIKVIDEIAFQTNILALNAAVEAARAGEAGMGFAVVADEVRNLAQRCAQAARDTAELIEESIGRSNEGSSRLNEVSNSIGEVTGHAGKVKLLVDEIHVGSKEQSRGIEQVAGAVTQMQRVTQSNASSAEESAAAGKELTAQAENLRQLVGELNHLVGSGGTVSRIQQIEASLRAKPQRPTSPNALASAVSRRTPGNRVADRQPQAEELFPLEDGPR